MTKETKARLIVQTERLLKSPSACPEAIEGAKRFLKAVGTANERTEATAFLQELEEDLEPIDGLITFAKGPGAIKYFGVDGAKKFLEHAKKLKESGVRYCDCPACQLAEAILKEKDAILS